MLSHLSIAIVSALALSACSPARASTLSSSKLPKIELGLNDVAILLPYDSVPGLLKKAPTINGGSHVFVSDEILAQLSSILVSDRKIHAEEGFAFGPTGDETFESDVTAIGNVSGESPYRLVSLRFDPCVNELERKEGEPCEANIRLVFQPLFLAKGQVTAKDSNIHAIYRIEAKAFEDILDQLRGLRLEAGLASKDEALLPHPVIAKEGEESAYFKGLLAILENNLSLSNLKRVAFFGDTDSNRQGHWPMVAFNVENGRSVLVPLDKLGKQEGEMQKNVQRLHGNHEHLGEPLPRGMIADSLFPILSLTGNEDPETIQKTLTEFMLSKYKNSFALDNPTLHDPMTVDCASCHVADIQRSAVQPEMKAQGIELPMGLGFQSERFNLSGNIPAGFSQVSLQIFSYFKTFPKIAPRAANDAAHSAEHINRAIGVNRK